MSLESLKTSLSVHDLVVHAAMSGLDQLLCQVIAEQEITPETREVARRIALAGDRHSTAALLTLH